MSVRVPANPEIIQWATTQIKEPEALVQADPRITKWISGDLQPTWQQLQDFARKVGTPFGYFFLDEIPERKLPIADFRDGFTGAPTKVSSELWATINICERRQNWFADFAQELGYDDVPVVGIAETWEPIETAAHMRSILGFEVSKRSGNNSDQRKFLISAFEELGGLTVFNSMVHDNSHRLLDEDEFRGFSLVDKIAPLIFVNTRQTINGQLFTFAHELAHVWRGRGGLGNSTVNTDSRSTIEQWCNAVANEFLVPEADVKTRFSRTTSPIFTEKLEELARVYRCGTLVVLFALKRAGIVPQHDFSTLYETEVQRLSSFQKPRSSGGNINYNRRFRIGETFSRAVIQEFSAGRLTPTQAMSLTGIKTMASFESYAQFIQEH